FLAEHVCGAVVVGAPVLLAPVGDERAGGLLAVHPCQGTDEPGLLDLGLVFAAASDRSHVACSTRVVVPAHQSAGCPRRPRPGTGPSPPGRGRAGTEMFKGR